MPDVLGRKLSFGTYTAPPHVRFLSWLLLLNGTGRIRRLGLSEPPGHGKSELIDYYYPTWLLEHDDRRRIILASYSGQLAEEQGKRVRNLIESSAEQLHVRLAGDSRASDKWRTSNGVGGMWTVGIGGTVTGRRASHMIIDDPVKNMAEAMSETTQGSTWDWYTSTARTRSLPRSSIALVQTRWSMNDLSGRIRTADVDRNDWLFVDLPAIALQNETCESVLGPVWTARLKAMGIPLFPWFREQGEPLWPELEPGVPWFDLVELEEIRFEVGEIVWSALYQQSPSPLEGNLFKRDKWQYINAMPPGPATIVRRWDMAASEGKGDWTASCLMALHHRTRMPYILDMTRDRLGPEAVENLIAATAAADVERYGKELYIRIEREPGSSGKNVESYYKRNVLPGYNVEFFPSSGDKVVRSFPLSSQQGSGLVHLVRRDMGGYFETPPWWQWLIDESAVFPNGAHDDMTDVASAAYVDLIELKPRKSRATAATAASRQLNGGAPSLYDR